MTRFLLDTNHLSDAIRPAPAMRSRLREAARAGHTFGTCVPVLGELEAGILQTASPRAYRQRLRLLSSLLRVWPLDLPIARHFGELFIELRHAGRVLSQVDILQAALCRHMNLVLLSSDNDFDALPEIRRENWL